MTASSFVQFDGSGSTPRRIGSKRKRSLRFELLETRRMLSASSIDGRPFVDIGPSDNVAWDQPRVTVQFLTEDFPDGTDPSSNIIVGPNTFNTWLLDTGANTTLVFQTAVNDMREFEPRYQTSGLYAELGVGGLSFYDTSIPYRFDFSDSTDFERNTLLDVSVISNPNNDISIFGPWGITGMPAMTERVTTFDFTPWTTLAEFDLFMKVNFEDELPTPLGPRYSISVDNRISFDVEDGWIEGPDLPMWADLPFFTAELKNNENLTSGNFLFDTGAQVSIISSELAFNAGLDSNQDGVLSELDANFARFETIGGISGTVQVPVFLIDEVHIQTDQGSDLVWTDLQWVILDIVEGIDGVFGFDNMTSGWIEAFGVDGQSGYLMQSHVDFRGWETTGEGKIYFDVNPALHTRVDPNGPGAEVLESGGITAVSENGFMDSYDIRLTEQPTANVTVSFVGSANQAFAYDAANPSNQFVVFTPQNWDIPQTVAVAAVNDGTAEGYHRVFMRNVASSSDPNYDGVGMPRISVSVIDDDFAGVMLLPTDGETTVSEDGQVDYYDVVLVTEPTTDVSIVIEHVAQQVVVASNATGSDTLVFSPTNWNVPQRVRVTAIDDPFVEGTHPAYITHRISTSDQNYQQAFILQERAVIIDNDGETVPPTVSAVWGTSSTWTPAFIDAVDGNGGSGIGVELSTNARLPWNNVDRFVVQFSEDVQLVSGSTLEVRDSNGLVPSTISYDATTFRAQVQLHAARPMSKLRLAVSDVVLDRAGNALDGDGTAGAGGIFDLRFDILPADTTGNGRVGTEDLTLFAPSFNLQPGDSAYNPRVDWNGQPRVNTQDLVVFSQHFGLNLNGLSEPGAAFGGGNGGGGSSINIGLDRPTNPTTASAWLTSPYMAWDGKSSGAWSEESVRSYNPFLVAALRRRDTLLAERDSQPQPVNTSSGAGYSATVAVELPILKTMNDERSRKESSFDLAIIQLSEDLATSTGSFALNYSIPFDNNVATPVTDLLAATDDNDRRRRSEALEVFFEDL